MCVSSTRGAEASFYPLGLPHHFEHLSAQTTLSRFQFAKPQGQSEEATQRHWLQLPEGQRTQVSLEKTTATLRRVLSW